MNHKTDFDDLTRRVEEIKKEKETSRLEDANRRKYQMWKRDNPRLRSAEGLFKSLWPINYGPIGSHHIMDTLAIEFYIQKDFFQFLLIYSKFSDIDHR